MRKRKLRWAVAGLAVGLVVLGGGLAFVLRPLPPSGVTGKYFGEIKIGMHRTKVEALLGGPPGTYCTVATDGTYRSMNPGYPAGGHVSFWWTDEDDIAVSFDAQDCVCAMNYYPMPPAHPLSIANVRWRVKRQWREWFPEK